MATPRSLAGFSLCLQGLVSLIFSIPFRPPYLPLIKASGLYFSLTTPLLMTFHSTMIYSAICSSENPIVNHIAEATASSIKPAFQRT